MATIGTVLTPQMPKQVWQADDGRVFDTEQECVTYEGADKVMRLLYEESGEKRHWDDLEQLESEVTSHYKECGFTYSDPCQTLVLLWQATGNRYHLMCHAPYLEELGRFLKDQDD